MRPFFQTFHTPSAVAKFRGLKSIAVVLCIGACSLTHAAIIEFSGQLDVILIDYGGAIYSDVQTGTFFSGSIDDATFDGDISDGTTLTPFTERGGGMWTENDQIMDADTATLINSLAGTSFVAGDLYDEIEMGGAASTSGEGYIEISLIFILDPLAFNNNPVDYYPPNPDDIVLVIFLIEELVGQEEVIYLALGAVDADSDGVGDHDDFCSNTAIPESVPALGQLKPNHWALTAAGNGFDFDTVLKGKGKGPNRSYTIEDTAGCSCEQIIAEQGLGDGHSKHGCSISAMDDWVDVVNMP